MDNPRMSTLKNADITTGRCITIGDIRLDILTPTPQALQTARTTAPTNTTTTPLALGAPNPFAQPKGTDHAKPLAKFNLKQFQDDDSIINRTSITFIAEEKTTGQRVLFLADAPTADVITALHNRNYSQNNPISVDALKVSHHGSKHNTSQTLLSFINTQHFIISANGTNQYHFPTKQALAHIIRRSSPFGGVGEGTYLYHNHQNQTLQNIFTPDEITNNKINQIFPTQPNPYIQIPL
jgi:hypothetical protein